jgi:predicted Zn-dependent protease
MSDLLKAEFTKRIRDAVSLRDWNSLEHWARQWILSEPKNPAGFKWLARASVALKKQTRAAYAYARLLDFEPHNEEAKKFLLEHPGLPESSQDSAQSSLVESSSKDLSGTESQKFRLVPREREDLAASELQLAEKYDRFRLPAEAATAFKKSFDWHPTQAAALGYAKSLHFSHRSSEASRFLRDRLNQFPKWTEGRMLLARILFDTGVRLEAQSELQQTLKIDPNHKDALDLLKSLYTLTI